MARLRKKERSDAGGSWLTTYGDLMTNLLCFFVLLFSMATVDQQKYEEVANSLRNTFSKMSGGNEFKSNMGKSILTVDFVNPDDSGKKRTNDERYIETAEDIIIDDKKKVESQKLQRAKEQLEIDINALGIGDMAEIIEEKDYLLIRLNEQILFKSGSAEILAEGKETLDILGKSLVPLENEILVFGHTDTLPINTALFPSNWELSTKRATNVVLYLIDSLELDSSKFTAGGNGEFKPIGDNNTVEGRMKNRRIEFMILIN